MNHILYYIEEKCYARGHNGSTKKLRSWWDEPVGDGDGIEIRVEGIVGIVTLIHGILHLIHLSTFLIRYGELIEVILRHEL